MPAHSIGQSPSPESRLTSQTMSINTAARETWGGLGAYDELGLALDKEAGTPDFFKNLAAERPHLFSNVPVFLARSSLAEMREIVEAIETTARLPSYRDAVLSWAPDISREDHGPAGVLMGYDSHLDDDGPKLIEVNTNAGGAFLNAVLAKAQTSAFR